MSNNFVIFVCFCRCSSFDEYAAEVRSGRLEWSPVHRSDKFWVSLSSDHRTVEIHTLDIFSLRLTHVCILEGGALAPPPPPSSSLCAISKVIVAVWHAHASQFPLPLNGRVEVFHLKPCINTDICLFVLERECDETE